jgi:hypothetical protein
MNALFYTMHPKDRHEICRCGLRRGLHRWDTEECPNRLWKPGNGQPHWLAITFERRVQCEPVAQP